MYEKPLRSDELYHFGVKGMHWGIRRYQNYDGRLTSKGKRRYSISSDNVKPTFEKTKPKRGERNSSVNGKRVAVGILTVVGAATVLAAKETSHYEAHRYLTGKNLGMNGKDFTDYLVKRYSENPFRQYRL